ncbi:MAG: DUF6542 domain-containing protein [Gordonia sp. (in: high G+C Gram-positive bacteria)]|uniref:DUF6542 domain-containing protein n=1 Tax=Gordonia sp. (in: high G+C Gram-positive bacteria) TaxID=84139 RepID=UPI003BB75AE2
MASRILSSTPVPTDTQSVLPRAVGVPWWGAVLIAAGFTTVGAIIDVQVNSALGLIYNSFFVVGCVLAVLAVRRRALFTAAVQPPLITMVIGLIALYSMVLSTSDSAAPQGMRKAVLEVVLPFSNLFPWIIGTFVLCGLIALARWFGTRIATDGAESSDQRKSTAPQKPAKARAKRATSSAARKTTAGSKPAAATTTARGKPARSKPAGSRPTATRATDAPTAVRPRPVERTTVSPRPTPTEPAAPAARRAATGASRPVRRDPSAVGQGDRPVRRAQPQVIPPRADGPRRTAGQLRDTGAIEDLTAGLDD